MRSGLRAAGGRDGADVVDMTTGQTLFSVGARRCRGCRPRSRRSTRPRRRCCASGPNAADDAGPRRRHVRPRRRLPRHAVPEGRRRSDVRIEELRPLRLRDRGDDAAARRQPDPGDRDHVGQRPDRRRRVLLRLAARDARHTATRPSSWIEGELSAPRLQPRPRQPAGHARSSAGRRCSPPSSSPAR